MGQIRCMQKRLAALVSSERGVAIEMVLVVMVIGLGFSAVAINSAITAQSGTTRDQARKYALAIADAGAQRALYTYNKITTMAAPGAAPVGPCVLKTGSGSTATLKAGSIDPTTTPFCAPIGGPDDPDATVGSGYFTYWVHPCTTQMQAGACNFAPGQTRVIKIVSEGCSNMDPTCAGGITRRVALTASGLLGSLATGQAKAIGLDGITMAGWTEMEVPAATNGSLVMKDEDGCPGPGYPDSPPGNSACPRICPGDWNYPVEVSVGPDPNDVVELPGTQPCNFGRDLSLPLGWPGGPRNNPPGPPESSAVVIHRTISLTPVDISSANKKNQNGNLGSCTTDWTNRAAYDAALAWNASHPKPQWKPLPAAVYKSQPGCTLNIGGDTTSGPGTVDWNSTTRTLTMNGTGDSSHRLILALKGTTYSFCNLQLTGAAQLQTTALGPMPGTTNVASKLFFDSPEKCPGIKSPQVSIQNESNITSAKWDARITPPDGPGVLPLIAMVGSNTRKTQFDFETTNWLYANKLMVYAPRTDIRLNTWTRENEGWYAGKMLTMKSGAEIESPPSLDPVGVGIVPSDYIRFSQLSYVECGPSVGTTRDANC
jgi:hypothetical protein